MKYVKRNIHDSVFCMFMAIGIGFFLCNSQCYGQKIEYEVAAYKIILDVMDGQRVKGFLSKVDSTGVTLNLINGIQHFEPKEIKKLRINKKGALLRGAGIGFLAGAVIGGGGVLLVGKDDKQPDNFLEDALTVTQTKEQKAVTAGIVGGGIGAIIGLSASRRGFKVKGERQRYMKLLADIKEYTLN